MKELGELIVAERKKKGFSQRELAAKIGLSTNALCSIETGKCFPTSATLNKICSFLGVKMVVSFVDATMDFKPLIEAMMGLLNATKSLETSTREFNDIMKENCTLCQDRKDQ